MLTKYKIPEKLGKEAEGIDDDFEYAVKSTTVREEPEMSGGLAMLLEFRFNNADLPDNVDVSATAYESSEEKVSGPDLGFRFQFVTENFGIRNGFLAQAKRSTNHDPELPLQCFKMTSRTEESYIFRYSESGVTVFPALPVYLDNGTGGKFTKYYNMSFGTFFERFFEGFLGEPVIAQNIDKPSESSPLTERANYLLDVKVACGDIERDTLEDYFDVVDREYYHTKSLQDSYEDRFGDRYSDFY